MEMHTINKTIEPNVMMTIPRGYIQLAASIINNAVYNYITSKFYLSEDYKEYYINKRINKLLEMNKYSKEKCIELATTSYKESCRCWESRLISATAFFNSRDFREYSLGKIHSDWIIEKCDKLATNLKIKAMIPHKKWAREPLTLTDGIKYMYHRINNIMLEY